MSDEKQTPEEELLKAYRKAEKHILNTVKRSVSDDPEEVVREVENTIRLELHKVAEKNASFIRTLHADVAPPRARLRQGNGSGGWITRSAYIELNSALSAASEDLMARLRKDIEPMRNKVTSLYDVKRTILDDFRSAGIMNVTYRNGHRVTLDKYVEMVTTSARNETDNDGAEQRAKESGTDYVYMAPARNACPVCGSKGDRVYCISGRDPDFPKLYGDLWEAEYKSIHPHCRCRLVPWHKEQYTIDELKRLTKSSNRPFTDRNGKPLDTQSEAARRQYAAQQDFNRKVWREQSEFEYYKSRYGSQFPYSTLGGYRRARWANSAELTDWLDKHAVQQATEGPRVRTGNSSDKRQYERWTAILGADRVSGSLDKFRDLKYNKPAEFAQISREKETVEKIQNKSWTPEFKNRAKQTYYDFRKKGIEITDHGIARLLQRGFGDEVAEIHGKAFNYTQDDGKKVKYYDGIAMVYDKNGIAVVSIIRRKFKKDGWHDI